MITLAEAFLIGWAVIATVMAIRYNAMRHESNIRIVALLQKPQLYEALRSKWLAHEKTMTAAPKQ